MRLLRARHGADLLLLRWLGREQGILRDPAAASYVLQRTPEPFAAAAREKQSALTHLEPDAVLASTGADPAGRRCFNEEVLQSGCPVHELAPAMLCLIDEEIGTLLPRGGPFGWEEFAPKRLRR